MKFNTATITGILAFATSATAVSDQLVTNACSESVYLTLYSNGTTNGPFVLLSAQAYISDIIGKGNTCTVSKSPDIYSPFTAKLVLGTTTDNGVLYW